ncbi:MAG: hypothetical protein V4563_18105 [Pseudomonadota bacterium]
MTIPIQELAAGLMALHLGSDAFMVAVLRQQHKLFAQPITLHDDRYEVEDIRKIKNFRIRLFSLSLVILLGNTIPILIDGLTLISSNTGRPNHVHTISILYALSNALTAIISAYLISTLYRIARGANDPNELVEKEVQKQ